MEKHQFDLAAGDDVVSVLDDMRAQKPGSRLGVGGSWASDKRLFDDGRLPSLKKAIKRAIKDRVAFIDAWGLICEPGDIIRPHNHIISHRGGENDIAGAYYATDGDMFFYNDGEIKPEAGLCLIFPASTMHWTEAATARRYVVGFNVILKRA